MQYIRELEREKGMDCAYIVIEEMSEHGKVKIQQIFDLFAQRVKELAKNFQKTTEMQKNTNFDPTQPLGFFFLSFFHFFIFFCFFVFWEIGLFFVALTKMQMCEMLEVWIFFF